MNIPQPDGSQPPIHIGGESIGAMREREQLVGLEDAHMIRERVRNLSSEERQGRWDNEAEISRMCRAETRELRSYYKPLAGVVLATLGADVAIAADLAISQPLLGEDIEAGYEYAVHGIVALLGATGVAKVAKKMWPHHEAISNYRRSLDWYRHHS